MRSDDSDIEAGPGLVEDDEDSIYFLSGSGAREAGKALLPEMDMSPFPVVPVSVQSVPAMRWKLPALICSALLVLFVVRHIHGKPEHKAPVTERAGISRHIDPARATPAKPVSPPDDFWPEALLKDHQPDVIRDKVAVPVYGNMTRVVNMPGIGRSDPFKPLVSAGRLASLSTGRKKPVALHAAVLVPVLPAPGNATAAAGNPVDVPPPVVEKVPQYRLEAVMCLQDKETALISEGEKAYVVNAGAALSDGYIVADISSRSVILDKDGKRMELNL
ncbi:MAG: hypothetical protein PHT33_05310 [bacterium]|nr:hypothetical protein [bacterium]